LQLHELMYWIGLAAWVTSGLCIGSIGFRNSAWWGPRRSASEKLGPVDMKIAKIAGIFFILGIFFFIIGKLLQK